MRRTHRIRHGIPHSTPPHPNDNGHTVSYDNGSWCALLPRALHKLGSASRLPPGWTVRVLVGGGYCGCAEALPVAQHGLAMPTLATTAIACIVRGVSTQRAAQWRGGITLCATQELTRAPPPASDQL